jgi:twitching motility protein PilT
MSTPIPLLGRVALHLKFITPDQLAQATRLQADKGGENRLGEVLVERGMLTHDQLQAVLKARQQVVAKARAKQAVVQANPAPETAGAAPSAARAETPPASASRPTAADAGPAAPTDRDAQDLVALLRRGVELGASDIHIHSATPLRMRLHGSFCQEGDAPLEPADTARMLHAAMTSEQRAHFHAAGEIDFAYTVPALGRFRVNCYRQQRGPDGVFRSIPAEPPTLEELGLPGELARFTNHHQGMVLVTGPANCGKSSTMAALVDIINAERKEHILTVEDPIEVLHPSKRCLVNQRNVGPHTDSFARALRGALREDPDVIVIGELRDLETISLALTAAETGHLVLASMHTGSSIRTINRLVGVFPADQQDQIRNMVSESLRAVVSQRLVPTADGHGRAPALEVLVNNKAIGNLIRENKTFQIFSILQTGAAQGMCLLDDSLSKLVASGTIARETALEHCDDLRRFGGGS